MPLQYQLLEILVNPNVAYLLILLGLVGIGDRALQPRADRARDDRRDLAPARPLRHRAAAGHRRRGAAARLRGGDDHRRGAPARPTASSAPPGWWRWSPRACCCTTPTRARSRSRPPVVIVAGLLLGGFLAFAVERGGRRRARLPVRTGWEEMVGAVGEVREPLDPVGQIFVEGALWRGAALATTAPTADRPMRALERGSRVRVESVEGLTLRVRPLERRTPRRPAERRKREGAASGCRHRDRRRPRRSSC